MGLGRFWLSVKQKYGKGIAVAYYRDVLRPRILESSPVTGLTDGQCELHVMTCKFDWLNLMWSLKSFYSTSEKKYMLCIHEDGSLGTNEIEILATHFPDARIIRRENSNSQVLPALEEYRLTHQFRTNNILAPKVTDFIYYLNSERMLLFDSDLMFFSKPIDLLTKIDSPERTNYFNRDVGYAYPVTLDELEKHLDFEITACVNSGLGIIQADSIRYDWIEEFLSIPGMMEGHFWRIEQAMFALCSSRYGVDFLSKDYDLYLNAGIDGRPFRHYVGQIRHLMYKEGMKAAAVSGVISL